MQKIFFYSWDWNVKYKRLISDSASFKVQGFTRQRFSDKTINLARGCSMISTFVYDRIDQPLINALVDLKVKAIFNRCTGFDNIDTDYAIKKGIRVFHIHSLADSHSVSEWALALMILATKKIDQIVKKVKNYDFSLPASPNLFIGNMTIGIIGTGIIGCHLISILRGFGCRILAYDVVSRELNGVTYLNLPHLLTQSQIIFLTLPLNSKTRYLFNARRFKMCARQPIIINTSRAELIDDNALLTALDQNQISFYASDVFDYNQLLYYDLSHNPPKLKKLNQFLDHPKVLLTNHVAYFSDASIYEICTITRSNILFFLTGSCSNSVFELIKN